MGVRLNKVLTELNIGLQTAVDFLIRNNIGEIKENVPPNTKISNEQYEALIKRFKVAKATHSEQAKEKPRPRIKQLGKIDFSSLVQDKAPVQAHNSSAIEKPNESIVTLIADVAQLNYKTCKPKTLDKFAYFPKNNDKGIHGWDNAINKLADIALDECWYYNEKDKQTKSILRNYLSYTFKRLQYEDEVEKKKAEKEGSLPKLKILENEGNAIFNTGLLDDIYEPIYAFFSRNHGKNPVVTQPWVFMDFATANSNFQNIITNFDEKPERAEYFENPSDLYYDYKAQGPTINWEHIFKDNLERLPIGFVKKGATEGFPFVDNVETLSKPQQRAYYDKLAQAIYNDANWQLTLTSRFKEALNFALQRVVLNYRTVLPFYDEKKHKIELLLPLALENNNVIDVALVCEHKKDKAGKVNNYVGRTIFTLQMAYNNARLISRLDKDWLTMDICIAK